MENEKKRKRVYADPSFACAFPVLVIISLSMTIWMLWLAIHAAVNNEKGALFFAILMG